MKLKLSLSAKVDGSGRSQLIIVMVHGKLNARAKSEVYIYPKYFDEKKGEVKTIRPNRTVSPIEREEHEHCRLQVQTLLDEITKAFNKEADKAAIGKNWLPDFVKNYLHPAVHKSDKKQSFFDLSEVYLADPNKAFSDYHKRNFRVLFRIAARYEGFLRETENPDFTFDYDTITDEGIEDFRSYIRNEKSLSEDYPNIFAKLLASYPAGVDIRRTASIHERGENTVYKLMKKLKAYFGWLREKKYTTNNPFEGVKLGSEHHGSPYYISSAERDQIATFDFSDNKSLEVQRDIFVFHCLIGCRVGDLIQLTPDHITDGILAYTPHKTRSKEVTARVPLHPQALALIEKYKGVDKDGRLFPFITPQRYNDAIKHIFTAVGITRNVEVYNALTGEEELRPINEIASSHLARRTFVGNLYFKVQDPNLIGKMSGHVEGSTAFARYRNIEDKTLRDLINKL